MPEEQSITCPACGRPADTMGVLANTERVYLHGSSFCRHSIDDKTGLLQPAVDQIRWYLKTVTPSGGGPDA